MILLEVNILRAYYYNKQGVCAIGFCKFELDRLLTASEFMVAVARLRNGT